MSPRGDADTRVPVSDAALCGETGVDTRADAESGCGAGAADDVAAEAPATTHVSATLKDTTRTDDLANVVMLVSLVPPKDGPQVRKGYSIRLNRPSSSWALCSFSTP